MRKFTFYFKSLLLAAGLLMGSTSAWAESQIFSEDFSGPSYNVTWGGTSAGGISPAVADGALKVANGSQSGDRSAYVAFGSNAYTGCCRLTFDMGMTKSGWSGKSNYFHVLPSATTARYPDTSKSALSVTQYDSGEITIAGESVGTYNGTMLTYDLYLNTVTGYAKVIVKNGETTLKTISYATTATGINTFNLQFNKNYGAFAIDNIKFYSLTAPAFTLSENSKTVTVGGSETVNVTGITGDVSVVSNNTSIATASYSAGTITINGVASGVTTLMVTATNDGLTTEKSIEVTVGDVATTTVTVNYLCGGSPIAEALELTDVTVGSTLTLSDITYSDVIAGVGCRYANPTFSVDFPYTVVGDDVINITYTQQNAVSSLNVYASVNSTNHLIKTYDLDGKYVGDVVTITYPEYYLENGTLYSTAVNAHGDGYYKWNHTLAGNSVEITYGTTAASNVVSYVEAESISGGTASSSGNADIRCSDGKGATFASATNVVTLSAGKYHIYAQLWGNAGATLTFSDGTNDILTGETKGYLLTEDAEFTITESKTITVTGGNGSKVLDLVYIVKVAESVTVTAAGYATYVPSYDLDFSTTEIKAYKVKITGKETATLSPVDKVPAGAPVLLYKEGGATENIPVTTGAAAIPSSENNLVAGTGAAVATTDGDYTNMILNNGASGIGFYFANDQIVAANRAYLHIAPTLAPDPVAGTKSLKVVFAGTATEVVAPAAADVEEEEVLYNMAGVQVDKNFKGFVINQKGVKRFNK